MDPKPKTTKPLDLKGSEQHHDLKNRPGEDGAQDHDASDPKKTLKGETARAAKSSDADTQIRLLFRPLPDRQRRAHGALGVILVHPRGPKTARRRHLR